MADQRIEHVINCSADDFWKTFFTEEYNHAMFLKTLKFENWTQVSFDETDTEIRRVTDATPKVDDLPGPMKKLAAGGIGYREEGIFNKKSQRFEIKIITGSMPDKISIAGVLFTEPAGDGKCKRVYTTTVKAKVFGIGGMIEKKVISDVVRSYDSTARFTNKYIADNS
ncbi:MAG: DUF2505 domain-containing protein [Polyangiaceae bacterium]|nr:DUF2505 domain-containing protein [Polyangiaceae bacterium]